jgi:hypothetical protein
MHKMGMRKPAILRQTKHGVPSKMAPFDHKDKDEGKAHGRGHANYSVDEINEHATQKKGHVGRVTKGGGAHGGTEPRADHINEGAFGHPKFPTSGDMKASNPKTGNVLMKGKIPKTGGQYGGGGRDTQ